jgi:hypothetical protein
VCGIGYPQPSLHRVFNHLDAFNGDVVRHQRDWLCKLLPKCRQLVLAVTLHILISVQDDAIIIAFMVPAH